MKIILFGERGQLGWELQRSLAPVGTIYNFSSSKLDLKNLVELKQAIEEIKPNLIVNASAYTAVDRAEAEPDIAMRINAEAPTLMAECAKKLDAVLIHYSTDYVFDGAKEIPYIEKDLTNPLNVYGQSKLKGEQGISQVGGAYIILRTSWVYSLRGENFVTKVLAWAQKKESLQVVNDQIGSPTWARALAEVSGALVAQSMRDPQEYFSSTRGIYHLGGSGSVSRFEFADAILRLNPLTRQLKFTIKPALTSDFPTPAVRPLFTALDCSHFENIFGLQLPGWQESLKLALGEDS